MLDFFSRLFDTSGFVPRRLCGDWTAELVQLHVLADGLIWLAYLAIPVLLLIFIRRRRDLPYPWLFGLFGAFIVLCGFSHLTEALMFYYPVYRFGGLLKLATAIVSLVTVAALVPILPKALALASPADLRREIEEKSRLEEQLRLAVTELERSNRELQEFASVASHDLQEPLRKIQAFGDRLRAKCGDSLTEDGQGYLERMQNAAGRMRTLIEDLLAFSRVTTRAQPFALVNLNEVAQGVISDLEGRLHQTEGTVELGNLPTIEADPMQMRQLLQNLIGNALKFHRPGVPPLIRVSARALSAEEAWGLPVPSAMTEALASNSEDDVNGAPYCEIAVEDNGIGFDEKYLDRIFNVFQRLHGRSEYDGTGVGLAICRKIVDRHGGGITARSEPGKGSTFLVRLPRIRPGGDPVEELMEEHTTNTNAWDTKAEEEEVKP